MASEAFAQHGGPHGSRRAGGAPRPEDRVIDAPHPVEARSAVSTDEALLPHPRILDRLFNGEPARHMLAYALKDLAPGRAAVVSSLGADSAVLLHLVASIAPATPVIFLETGKHFAETLSFRDRLVERLRLSDVRSVTPDPAALTARDPAGDLHAWNADACCDLRKRKPLAAALADFDVWVTGRRRHQVASRARLALFERADGRIKVNPLAAWAPDDVAAYLALHDLPAHPLVAQGYPSIGCAPCTDRIAPGEDARAGRWRGLDKTECGIHFSHNGEIIRTVARAGA